MYSEIKFGNQNIKCKTNPATPYFPVVQNVSVGDTLNISIKSVHGGQLYFRLCEIFEMDKCFTRQKLYILESEDYGKVYVFYVLIPDTKFHWRTYRLAVTLSGS
jgi:hypothetical protein